MSAPRPCSRRQFVQLAAGAPLLGAGVWVQPSVQGKPPTSRPDEGYDRPDGDPTNTRNALGFSWERIHVGSVGAVMMLRHGLQSEDLAVEGYVRRLGVARVPLDRGQVILRGEIEAPDPPDCYLHNTRDERLRQRGKGQVIDELLVAQAPKSPAPAAPASTNPGPALSGAPRSTGRTGPRPGRPRPRR